MWLSYLFTMLPLQHLISSYQNKGVTLIIIRLKGGFKFCKQHKVIIYVNQNLMIRDHQVRKIIILEAYIFLDGFFCVSHHSFVIRKYNVSTILLSMKLYIKVILLIMFLLFIIIKYCYSNAYDVYYWRGSGRRGRNSMQCYHKELISQAEGSSIDSTVCTYSLLDQHILIHL